MNVLVIAALALIFMVIMMAIFSGKIQILGSSSECLQRGGACEERTDCIFTQTGYTCEKEGKICCMDPSKIS